MSDASKFQTYDLKAFWRKKDNDLVVDGPCGPDRHLMFGALTMKRWTSEGNIDRSLFDELIMRGYDVTTIKFSVRMFRHPWITCGRNVWHKRTKQHRRIHHVRYEAGAAYVLTVDPAQDFSRVDVPANVNGHGYVTLEYVEENYTPERPAELREILAAEGVGL